MSDGITDGGTPTGTLGEGTPSGTMETFDPPIGTLGTPVLVVLKTEAGHDKYGLMIVRNRAGGLARVHRITGGELVALKSAGRYTPETHLHVTQDEWESGLAKCIGMGLDRGDVATDGNGRAMICYGDLGEMLVLERSEYTGTVPSISAEKVTLDRARAGRFASLANGVLEVI